MKRTAAILFDSGLVPVTSNTHVATVVGQLLDCWIVNHPARPISEVFGTPALRAMDQGGLVDARIFFLPHESQVTGRSTVLLPQDIPLWAPVVLWERVVPEREFAHAAAIAAVTMADVNGLELLRHLLR